MLEEFLHGKPTIYDVASFISIVLILCVLIGVHLRQIRHHRDLYRIASRLAEDEKIRADRAP